MPAFVHDLNTNHSVGEANLETSSTFLMKSLFVLSNLYFIYQEIEYNNQILIYVNLKIEIKLNKRIAKSQNSGTFIKFIDIAKLVSLKQTANLVPRG